VGNSHPVGSQLNVTNGSPAPLTSAAIGSHETPALAEVEVSDGQWVSIRHAASLGRVSVDTIRRRIRAEQIAWKRDIRGHYLVSLPSDLAWRSSRAQGAEATAGLLVRLRNCAALLTEVRAQRDQLLRQVDAQQRLLEAHAQAELDLRKLLLASRSTPA
jgi:hypothetical protein